MDTEQVASAFNNLDRRVARIEQILPTLATKDDLTTLATKDDLKVYLKKDEFHAVVATLATKDELRAAVATLATKDELQAAVATLATKDELREVRIELRETRDELKRHTMVLFESLRSDIQLLAEHVASSWGRPPRRPN